MKSFLQDGGTLLCAVDESNDHVLSVWDWAKEVKIAESKVERAFAQPTIGFCVLIIFA